MNDRTSANCIRAAGSVIIPAHNEQAVIARTLRSLCTPVGRESLEIVVVCNGCTDSTAEVARQFPGVRVMETDIPSKVAALNMGDSAASFWPRLYLDADVVMSRRDALSCFDELQSDGILAVRPTYEYATQNATWAVRRYYVARAHVLQAHPKALWGAGAYALNRAGHARAFPMPDLLADDLWVDNCFQAEEKVVAGASRVQVLVPTSTRALVWTLGRVYRGAKGQLESTNRSRKALLQGIKRPSDVLDAVAYVSLALAGRLIGWRQQGWARDETTRRPE